MAKTVLAVFSSRQDAENAISELNAEGFDPKDISIVMKSGDVHVDTSKDSNSDIAEDTLGGAATGAALGGLAGLVAATVIPGLGAIFIGGPIAAALGLTGAVATTVSGAATGAVAGGLIGALTSIGLDEDNARIYEEHINKGGVLLAVPTTKAHQNHVESIMSDNNADEIKILDSQMSQRRRIDEPEGYQYSYGAKGGSRRAEDTDFDDGI